MNDLVGGRLSFYFGGIPVNLPMIRAGKVKPLGTSGASERRSILTCRPLPSPVFPDSR